MPFGGLLTAGIGLASAGVSSGLIGGGGGGGGDNPSFVFNNPALQTTADLFGRRVSRKRGGIERFGPNKREAIEEASIFGGTNFQDSLRDFIFNPRGLSEAERVGVEGVLGDPAQTQALLGQTQQGLGRLTGFGQELAGTGFATDPTALFDRAQQQFETRSLPAIAERVGSQVGLRSQSFIDAATREAAELQGQAATQGVALREAAAGRRAAGLPLAASLQQQELATPLAFLNDLLSTGGTVRGIEEEGRARPFTAFSNIAGLTPGIAAGGQQGGFNPQGSGTAQSLGALAQALPGAISSIGGLFGGGGAASGGGIGGATNPTAISGAFNRGGGFGIGGF